MRLSAYSEKTPGTAPDSGRRITWLVLALPIDSSVARAAVTELVDSLTTLLGEPKWGYGIGRAAAVQLNLLHASWSITEGSLEEVSVTYALGKVLIALSSDEHERTFWSQFDRDLSEPQQAQTRAAETVEAEAGPDPWRVYEEWEVEAPASLISCRDEAPPVSHYGNVDIRLVVDAFGFATMPSVAPSSRFDLTRYEEVALEEWVKHSCRFLPAQKRGTAVQSRFRLTVRYR